jgi:hypothetical protein
MTKHGITEKQLRESDPANEVEINTYEEEKDVVSE